MKVDEIKQTKCSELLEVRNDMEFSNTFLIHYKIEKDNMILRLRHVQTVEIIDCLEYFDKDKVTKQEVIQCAKELSYFEVESIIECNNDFEGVVNDCNEIIEQYNKRVRY